MTESIYSLVSKEVIAKSRVQIFQHNTAIIKANQTLTHLYYILDGRAKFITLPNMVRTFLFIS